jgi:hypothetical protein
VLIHKGLSPGAALAFLLTGPATNATTFGVLSRLHGPRIAVAFGAGMALLTVGLGLAVNLALPHIEGIALYEAASQEPSLIQVVSLAALTLVLALSVLRQGPRGFVAQILAPYGKDEHEHGDHEHGDREHHHHDH